MKIKTLSRGFTLIELLVVIAIIGILSTLLILQLNTARSKARDTKRVSDISQLRTAIELYYDNNGSYPADISTATIGRYMSSGISPTDPSTAATYGYATTVVPRTKFQVWSNLENPGNANPATSGILNNDSDINDAALTVGTRANGTNEAGSGGKCTSAGSDCVFDTGAVN